MLMAISRLCLDHWLLPKLIKTLGYGKEQQDPQKGYGDFQKGGSDEPRGRSPRLLELLENGFACVPIIGKDDLLIGLKRLIEDHHSRSIIIFHTTTKSQNPTIFPY